MSKKHRRIQHVPGVVYAPLDDRAHISGSGVEPWMVLETMEVVNGDWNRLRATFDWLTDEQLRAAMAFCEVNPEWARERIEAEDAVDIEAVWREHPETAPRHR